MPRNIFLSIGKEIRELAYDPVEVTFAILDGLGPINSDSAKSSPGRLSSGYALEREGVKSEKVKTLMVS